MENLSVHHKNPYRESQDNSASNLVTLCKSCHFVVEFLLKTEFLTEAGLSRRTWRPFRPYIKESP